MILLTSTVSTAYNRFICVLSSNHPSYLYCILRFCCWKDCKEVSGNDQFKAFTSETVSCLSFSKFHLEDTLLVL